LPFPIGHDGKPLPFPLGPDGQPVGPGPGATGPQHLPGLPPGFRFDLHRPEHQNDPAWASVNAALHSATTEHARTEAAILAAQFLAQHDSPQEAEAVLTTLSDNVQSRVQQLRQAPQENGANSATEQELVTLHSQLEAIKAAQSNVSPMAGGAIEPTMTPPTSSVEDLSRQ
jgi:hypothetical protein